MHVSVVSSGYIRLYYACLPCLALTTWTQPRQRQTSRSCAVVPPLRHEKSNDRMPPAPCTETSCTPGQTCLCATCLCARCGSIIERLYPLKYTESSPAPQFPGAVLLHYSSLKLMQLVRLPLCHEKIERSDGPCHRQDLASATHPSRACASVVDVRV